MDVQAWTEQIDLDEVPGSILGFDLEMANSFRHRKGVICMIGLGWYDPKIRSAQTTIATITRPEDEESLIRWFLEQLDQFGKTHENPQLLSFSGLDNDVPWINERLVRLDIEDPEHSVLASFGHFDLKREFYNRTHNSKISLKKLEIIFGIERSSELTSKKVSYMLTSVLEKPGGTKPIPSRISEYLRQDVHHLLLILNQWTSQPLDGHHMSDIEYLTLLNSLANLTQKLLKSDRFRNEFGSEISKLESFDGNLRSQYDHVLIQDSFDGFELPEMPAINGKHFDIQRLHKKYNHLREIPVRDRKTGAVRLRRTLDRPKGALAVVRHQGKLLMMRRAEHLERSAGYWGLPGGGVESGESPSHGAVRELYEELGLEGHAVRVLGTSISVNGTFQLFWVEVEVDDIAQLSANPKEVAETRWVRPEEVGALTPLIAGAEEGIREFLGGAWGARRRKR